MAEEQALLPVLHEYCTEKPGKWGFSIFLNQNTSAVTCTRTYKDICVYTNKYVLRAVGPLLASEIFICK